MTIFMAGGGTGGHVYPALAMAQSLKKIKPDLEIHFVGTRQGMEAKIVPDQGFSLHFVPVGKLNSNVSRWERLKTLLTLPFAFLISAWLLFRFRPHLLVGVGGFASAPVILVGALLGYPTVIWEPNAYPGLANRLLARWVDLALVVFDEAKDYLAGQVKRIEKVGLPVREEIENLMLRAQAREQKKLSMKDNEPLRVLIFGGSQGARGINQTVSEALISREEWLKDFLFIHQTGSLDFSFIQKKYQNHQVSVEVREYLSRIHEQYEWADVVICRAGVSTIYELAAVGKAAVLVPFPFAADNHQQKNAEAVVKKNGALMVLQKDFTVDVFRETLLSLRNDVEKRKQLALNIRQWHEPHAAEKTAQILLNEIS